MTLLQPLLRTWQEDAARRPPFRVLLRVREHRKSKFSFTRDFYIIDPAGGRRVTLRWNVTWAEASNEIRGNCGYPQVTP